MRLFYTILTCLIALSAGAQDYFWVGGTGDWSDLSHWATTSGGDVMHETLPGPDNDVYLDENSFTAPGQTLSLDMEEAFCGSFDCSAATNNPTIQGDNYLDDLVVNGDIIVPATVNRDFKTLVLNGPGDHIVEMGEVDCGSLCFIRHTGSGTYTQQDSLSTANLYVYNDGGVWNTNGYPVNAYTRLRALWQGGVSIDATGSNIYTNEFSMPANNTLDFTDTHIYLTGSSSWPFEAEGYYLPYVEVVNTTSIETDLNVGTFTVAPGAEIELQPGVTVNAEQFDLNGTAEANVFINSNSAGEEATFAQAIGTVNGNFLVLQDLHATGGAEFNANYSVDNGNTDGWNITQLVPQTYYWVGGTGDWSDLSHWATTSGGAVNHVVVPSILDEVIFDANSFSNATDEVTIDIEANAASVNAADALEGVLVESYGLNSLNCFGDFNGGVLTWDLNDLVMDASAVSNLFIAGGDCTDSVVRLAGTGTVALQDSISVTQFRLENGTFISNGNAINASNYIQVTNPDESTADFSNSNLYVNSWAATSSWSTYIMEGSTIYVNAGFNAGNMVNYDKVVMVGDGFISSITSIDVLEILPDASLMLTDGAEVTLGDLIAEGTEDNLIEISCNDEGGTGTFIKESGAIEVSYVSLKDNHAIGGATFTAFDSEEQTNVMGWNFETTIGVEETTSDLKLWPNPSNGMVFMEFVGAADLTIFNTVGAIVFQDQLNTGQRQIDLSELKRGNYTLTITTNNGQRIVERIILQ